MERAMLKDGSYLTLGDLVVDEGTISTSLTVAKGSLDAIKKYYPSAKIVAIGYEGRYGVAY